MISYFKFLSVSLSISFLLSEWHVSWKQLFEDVFLDSILCERTKVTLNFPLGSKIMSENSNTKSLTCFCFKIILGPCFLTSCAGAEVNCLKCSYFYWKVQIYCAGELFICERTNIISPSFSLGWSVIIIKEQTIIGIVNYWALPKDPFWPNYIWTQTSLSTWRQIFLFTSTSMLACTVTCSSPTIFENFFIRLTRPAFFLQMSTNHKQIWPWL